MYVLPFVASDPNIQVIYPDPIIDKGTVMMWDTSRSDASVFANGTVFNDLAMDTSYAMLGADKNSLSSALAVPNYPAEFLTERTTKGGLHVMTTQNVLSGLGADGRMINLPLSSAVKSYMNNNSTHTFHVSFMGVFTRKPTTERPFFMFGTTSYTTNYYFNMRQTSTNSSADNSMPSTNATYQPSRFPDVGVPFMFTIEVSAKTGTWDLTGNIRSGIFQGVFSTVSAGGLASFIAYRVTINDLTVSGKTGATKRAEDLALFNSLFGSGGKFAGDTWTTPAI